MAEARHLDPRLARFLARHAVSEAEAVEADVAPHRGKSTAALWAETAMLARDAVWLLSRQHDLRRAALERDPPHPSYGEVIARLRRSRR